MEKMSTVAAAQEELHLTGAAKASCEPRLMPNVVDAVAKSDPDRVLGEFLEAPHGPHDGGTYELTFGVFARMIDRLSWWLREKGLEAGLKEFDTVALAGFLDLRHYVMLVAAMKCGYKVLICTLVSDPTDRAKLFEAAEAKVFLKTEKQGVPETQPNGGLPTFIVPSVEELSGPGEVRHFPYTKTWANAAEDPVIVFHTSGTTGFPKPRVWTNTHVGMGMDPDQSTPPLHGRELSGHIRPKRRGNQRLRRFCTLRCCYTSMLAGIGAAVFLDVLVIFHPFHDDSYSGDRAASWLEKSAVDELIAFPSFLIKSWDSKTMLEQLARIPKIYWCGAPMSWDLARLLVDRTHLSTLWGTTEIGFIPSHETDPEDWNWFCMDAEAHGVEWRERFPNRYQMVFVRNDGAKKRQPTFLTQPELLEYTSGDLFSKHPTKEDYWKCEGRGDNIINIHDMLFDPSDIERDIESHVSVRSAILLGFNYKALCLFLDPYEAPQDSRDLAKLVWPTIEKAFNGQPKKLKVEAAKVIVAKTEKPFPRNHKGEVKRIALADLYNTEMNECCGV